MYTLRQPLKWQRCTLLLPSGEASSVLGLLIFSEFLAVVPRALAGRCSSVCATPQGAALLQSSCAASGEEGGVLMTEELRCPEPAIAEPRGLDAKLCVGESSSELSEASLLASEFRLLVSERWPS